MSQKDEASDWTVPPPHFRYLIFERVHPDRNEERWYYLGWQASLLEENVVVRFYGRKGGFQRKAPLQYFASLDEAWPFIRRHILTRLRHGYRIVAGTRPEKSEHTG